jgi:hypothetical protein
MQNQDNSENLNNSDDALTDDHVTKTILLAAAFATNLLLFTARSQAAEFTFISSLDRFTVDILGDGTALYNGREVRSEPFVQVHQLFEASLADLCTKKRGAPDVTITRKTIDGVDKRILYVQEKVISDGLHCATVSGNGLYELPLHRNWFTGPSHLKLTLNSAFSVWRQNMKLISFQKEASQWVNEDHRFFTNWSFFRTFTEAMDSLTIDYRIHPDALKALDPMAASFEVKHGARTYTFTKLSEKRWAVKLASSPWLAVTGSLGFLEEMNLSLWRSPAAQHLGLLANSKAKPSLRIKAIHSLGPSWTYDATQVFTTILSHSDNLEVQKEIANLLRSRPSDENIKLLVLALEKNEDQRLKNHLSRALRVRNPKGPIIEEDDEDAVVTSKVKAWSSWSEILK